MLVKVFPATVSAGGGARTRITVPLGRRLSIKVGSISFAAVGSSRQRASFGHDLPRAGLSIFL